LKHLLVPVLFMAYVAIGLPRPETVAVSLAFAVAIVAGAFLGERVSWRDWLEVDEGVAVKAFVAALVIIALQVVTLGVPLLEPALRTSLNPRLTALTYFLGVPSSVYLFSRGKNYALLYPVAVSLYAYRTPVVVSAVALALVRPKRALPVLAAGTALFLLVTAMRGEGLYTLWVRFQSTVSVLDVIVWRAGLTGHYHGELQLSGVVSYIAGGYSPRGLIAKFLYIQTGSTITATLLGGMYLDFGVFSIVEGFLLGLYYGTLSRATKTATLAIYHSTLAYGIVGVETGILDLPVYALFALGLYVVYRGMRS